eukprot:SAG31_NODE_390_length_16345_cov_12.811523_8_plen_60_part_00
MQVDGFGLLVVPVMSSCNIIGTEARNCHKDSQELRGKRNSTFLATQPLLTLPEFVAFPH